jgi:iron complex transport system substrate-binding protein
MSWETLVGSDPEVIVLGLCGFDLARTIDEWATFEEPQALAQTPAWRDGQIWAIDGSAYISRPGPRLVDGVAILAAILAGRSDPRAVRLPRAG